MSPRTIALSLVGHALLGAALLAIDGEPRQRIATVVEIFSPKPPEPAPEPPKPEPEPPKPEPPPEPEAKPEPKPEPKPRRRLRAKTTAPETTTAPAKAPYFTGLVLGNADGPGLAVGVAEDVERGPREPGRSSGGRAGAVTSTAPVQPARPARRTCDRFEKPRVLERRRAMGYPDAARGDGAEGRLVLRVHVGADGAVTRVEVVSAVHPAIDREAIEAVRGWRFSPARRCDRAVPGTYVVARRFELTD